MIGAKTIATGKEDQALETFFLAGAHTGLQEGRLKLISMPVAMEGKSLVLGDWGSASGWFAPIYHTNKSFKKAPGDFFGKIGFSKDDFQTIEKIQAGEYDIGAVNSAIYKNMLQLGMVDTTNVKVIWRVAADPDYNWTIAADLNMRFGPGFTAKLLRYRLNMRERQLLAPFLRSRFVQIFNYDFRSLEMKAAELGISPDYINTHKAHVKWPDKPEKPEKANG